MAQIAAAIGERLGRAIKQEWPFLFIAGTVLIGVPAAAYSGSYADCADVKDDPEKETCKKTKIRGPHEIWIPIAMVVVPILLKFLWAVFVQHNNRNADMRQTAAKYIDRAMKHQAGMFTNLDEVMTTRNN